MKRFTLLGTAFFLAALLGIGISVGLAPSAQAQICDPDDWQWYCVEDDPLCASEPLFKAGGYNCGTLSPSGDPCVCEFARCVKGCPPSIPFP